MDAISLSVLLLLVTFVLSFLWKKSRTICNGAGKPIPGPPLIEGLRGFIKESNRNTLHLYLPRWAKQYGEIMQVNLLLRKVIFINDPSIYKRLINSMEFREVTNDRPPTFCGKYYYNNNSSVALATESYATDLQLRRKTFHNVLKFYGEGRDQFETVLSHFLYDMTKKLKATDSVEISTSLKGFVAKLLCFVFTGEIAEVTPEKMDAMVGFTEAIEKIFLFEVETILTPLPFLRFLPGLKYKRLHEDLLVAIANFSDKLVDYMRKKFDPNDKNGLIDDLLAVQQKLQKEDQKLQLDDYAIDGIIKDLTTGGYMTTSATLKTLFLNLLKNQSIQARMYQEIEQVIGEAVPSFKHRHEMPYTEAALLETLRISSILPLLLPRIVTKDITFEGYHFPKSTLLLMNAWQAHHREDYWNEPYSFIPERFLDDKGQLLPADHPVRQNMIPFGSGVRACPGEIFARARAFLISVYLLKHFEFVPDESAPLPSADPRDWIGLTILGPDEYKCKIKQRNVD